ncbi:uncharacterized protein K452DRAFT_299172 [Aplosporella prunicola CBS 121167]|uniref:Uncharacterized protein n=1 Tax=Aplosporella prunicola CBS 121167 TaxID=1176127 RepID=A0A6A6BD39_9PEZI|nr:uncharacterized protein K452DRAFT_299172 [Aplosporella prunicola CBS 121167]KAF2141134.1 hypothetical protein K452DRAFT_299172 [Aplosporella prunicola CBS 121167]
MFKELVLTSQLVLDNTEDLDMVAPNDLDPALPPRLYTSLGVLSFTAETVPIQAFKYRAHTIMGVEVLPPSTVEEAQWEHGLDCDRFADWGPINLAEWDDGAGRGIIRGMTLDTVKNGTAMEIVALSSFTSKGEADILYHYHGRNADASYSLPIINCLVIQWHEDGMAERVGFAQIGSTAWEEAKPARKAVLLR